MGGVKIPTSNFSKFCLGRPWGREVPLEGPPTPRNRFTLMTCAYFFNFIENWHTLARKARFLRSRPLQKRFTPMTCANFFNLTHFVHRNSRGPPCACASATAPAHPPVRLRISPCACSFKKLINSFCKVNPIYYYNVDQFWHVDSCWHPLALNCPFKNL